MDFVRVLGYAGRLNSFLRSSSCLRFSSCAMRSRASTHRLWLSTAHDTA